MKEKIISIFNEEFFYLLQRIVKKDEIEFQNKKKTMISAMVVLYRKEKKQNSITK